jgi:hypothetical protein
MAGSKPTPKLASRDCALTSCTYWFPAEDRGIDHVLVAVRWSRHDLCLQWAILPFKPGATPTLERVQFTGRMFATTRGKAEQIAWELFTFSAACLKLQHQDCTGFLVDRDEWREAPPCPCSCHQTHGRCLVKAR